MIYFPFYEVLDGTNPADYVQRVEPSAAGGQKIASALLDRLYGQNTGQNTRPNTRQSQNEGQRYGQNVPAVLKMGSHV